MRLGLWTLHVSCRFGLSLHKASYLYCRQLIRITGQSLINLSKNLASLIWVCAIPVFSDTDILIVDYNHLGQLASPANGSWELTLFTTPLNAVDPNAVYITFLPNSSVDTALTDESNLTFAKDVLSWAQTGLHNRTNVTVEILELVNWLFVSIYWTMFIDLGQVSPTITTPDGDITIPTTNNIFANPDLFNIYSSYLNDTVIPIVFGTSAIFPQFELPSNINSLNVSKTTFIRSYACNQRKWKSRLERVVSVILADYALIGLPYAIAVFFAVAIQKRVRSDCENSRNNADTRESL